VIPVMDAKPDRYTATIQMPDKASVKGFGALELDFGLSCAGDMDRDCSVWDRIVSLTVDCGAGANEFGRWINAFQRRVGRWLTPAPFMPLLYPAGGNGTCSFTVSIGNGDPWLSTLRLRFNPAGGVIGLSQPSVVFPLVYPNSGTGFSGPKYNENRTVAFSMPKGTTKAAIAAIITGHGGCEFAPTSHHFVVNGHQEFNTSNGEYTDRFMEAGTQFGCADKTSRGAVPNEHGTWYYGRNGWCDGQDVKPLVWDITSATTATGAQSLRYYGLSYADTNPKKPDDAGCGGNIQMASYLLFW